MSTDNESALGTMGGPAPYPTSLLGPRLSAHPPRRGTRAGGPALGPTGPPPRRCRGGAPNPRGARPTPAAIQRMNYNQAVALSMPDYPRAPFDRAVQEKR